MGSALVMTTRRTRLCHVGRRAATSGGWFDGAQRCERGHCLVTNSVVGSMGTVIGPGGKEKKLAANKWVQPDLNFLLIFKLRRTYKFKMEDFPSLKNIQTLHVARLEYF
jgi:hypothetical protein